MAREYRVSAEWQERQQTAEARGRRFAKPPQGRRRGRVMTHRQPLGVASRPSTLLSMSRYFFHIEGEKPHHDEVGKELADDGAAWAQAVRMLRHTENGMQPDDNWTLRVFKGEEPIYVIAVVSRRY